MPIDFSSSFPTEPSKEDTLAQTSAAKSVLLSDIASQKREKMLAPVNEALNKAYAAANAEIAENPAYHAPRVMEPRLEGFGRGLKEGAMSLPGSAIGVAAIAAATAETAFGEGGMATDLKERAVEQYVKFQQHMSKDAQPEDSFVYSYEQAKEGDLGALVTWATHGTGYVTSQLAAILTGAGIIGKGVELTSKRAIAKATGSLVEKEAAKIAAAAGLKTATEAMVKEATSNVTQLVAHRIGTGIVTTELVGGEIGGDLAHQSAERGTPLTGKELARGAAGTAAASATEYAGTILGLKGLQGKLGKLPGAGVDTAAIDGIAGRAARGVVTGAKVGPAEMAQEFVQTGFEIWGTGKDPRDPEHRTELIDATMLGGLSSVPTGAGATLRGSAREKQAAQTKAAKKRLVEAEAQPGFVGKVQAAVEAKNADQYMDSTKKDFNPVVGTKALRVLNQDENTSPADKHAHYNTAVRTYNDLKTRQLALLDRAENPKDPLTEKQAEAGMDFYSDLQAKMLPEIQAMGSTGTTSPELQKLLAQANDDASVEKALAQILGSRSGGQDLASFMDVDGITNNPVVGSKAKNTVRQIQALTASKKALAEHTSRAGKTTSQVTENIFAGTDGQKGINDYIAAIQTATSAKDTAFAQQELDQLAEFAESRQTRATTFRNILEGSATEADQQNLALYNKERQIRKQKPYNVGPAFESTIQAMELEADAVSKALTLGSTISKLTPKIPPTRKAAPSTVVETPGQTQSAVPSAPTSKTSPTPFTQKVVTSEVGDSSTKPSTVTAPVSGNEASAEAATVPGSETGKTLSHAEKTRKMFEAMSEEALNQVLKNVVQGSAKQTLVQQILKEKIAAIARAKKAGTFTQTKTETSNKESTDAKTDQTTPARTVAQTTETRSESNVQEKEIAGDAATPTSSKQGVDRRQARTTSGIEIKAERNKGLVRLWDRISARNRIAGQLDPESAQQYKEDLHDQLLGDYGVTSFADVRRVAAELDKKGVPYVIERSDGGNMGGVNKAHEGDHAAADKDIRKVWGDVYATRVREQGGILGRDQGDELMAIWPNYTVAEVAKLRAEIEQEIRTKRDELGYGKTLHEKAGLPTGALHISYGLVQGESGNFSKLEAKADALQNIQKLEEQHKIATEKGYVLNKETGKYEQRKVEQAARPVEGRRTSTAVGIDGEVSGPGNTTTGQEATQGDAAVKPAANQALTTPRDAADTNKVRTTFKATKTKSYFHQTADFLKSLPGIITRAREMKKDPDQITLLSDILEFTQEFTPAAQENFQYKENENFHHEDPLNWLAAQGVLPEVVTTATSAATYKWLATRAAETELNDADDARGILSLGSDAVLLPVTTELVSDIGSSSATLSASLGKDTLKVLGIKADTPAQAQVQERVEISLGLSALATMQKMGHLQRILISSASLAKLTAANKKLDFNFTMTAAELRAKRQETDAKFFRLVPSERTKAIKKAYSQSKGTWDTLFTGVKDKTEYSWRPFVLNASDTQAEMRKSKQKASVERTKKLNRNVNQPIQLAARTMNIFEVLNQEAKEAILGMESLDGLHKEQVKGVISANKAQERAYEQVQDWLHNADKRAGTGLKSLFRIPAYFGANTRMYQEGSINMLVNKGSHRYMFNMQEWEGTFDLANTEMTNLFLEAVGQSLKIESSKDLNFLASTQKALETPVMVEALAAIDKILKKLPDANNFDQKILAEITSTLTAEEMAAIAKGVKEGKQKMHTLKGLVEYQRFVNAQKAGDETFTTDLSFGMDGLANGATIALLQLMLSEPSPQLLGILQSAGLSFTDEVSPGQHAATYDPYQAIGAVWGNELAQMEKGLADNIRARRNRDANIQELDKIKAATSLLGPLYAEDGMLAKITRKLSKDRSVPALYGAGKDSLINGLLDTFVKTAIEEKLQALAASDSKLVRQEFIDFRNNVNRVAGTKNWGMVVIRPDGSLNKKALLSLKLTPEMQKGMQAYIAAYPGKALQTAITSIYGDIQAASKPLNEAVTIGVGYYNTAHDLLLAKHFKTNTEITVGELAAIRDKLQPLFPRIKTPHGDFIEVAEFEQSKDYDKANAQNITQRYRDPKISLLTGRPHKIGKLANPGVKPVVTATHMMDAATAVDVVGNDFGAAVLNAHDNAMVGLHQVKKINELVNSSFYKHNSKYSMAEALQASLAETQAAFKALGFVEGQTFNKNLKELELTQYKSATKVLAENKKTVANVVEVTKKNKALILGSATQVNQYFVAGQGHKTKNQQQEKIGNIPVADIVSLARAGVETLAASNVQLTNIVKATLEEIGKELGSRLEPMSTEAADYAIQQTIDSQNVVDTYDDLKQNSTVIDSPAHDAHLKGILNTLVVNVMDKVDLFQKTTTTNETHGQFKTGENKLFIASQVASPAPVSGALANGIRMSTGEVYVHELVHAVTHAGLRANKQLLHQTEVLFDLAAKALDFRAFLNDPTIDVKDPANHYDVQAAKDRFDYVFRGKSVTKRVYPDSVTKIQYTEELSHHLDEFVALGLTNANFLKALTGVSLVKHKQRLTAKSTWAGIIGDNLQETITNIFGKLLEILHEKLDRGISANNVGAELQRLAKLLTKIDSKNKTQLYNLTQEGLRRYGKLAGMANQMIKEAFKTAPVTKTVHNLKRGLKVARESETLLGESMRSIEYKVQNLDYGLIQSIVTEMKGHTARMDWIHRLLHRRKNFLDAAKTAAIATVTDVADSTFHRKMTSEEKVTFLKAGMKTDLAGLLYDLDIDQIAPLVGSKTVQQKEIDKIVKEIQANEALAPYAVYYNQSSDALGYHMVHGRFREGEHTTLSTQPISSLTNSTLHAGKLTEAQAAAADVLVNKLATLSALKYTSAQHLTTLSNLIAEDSEGITRLLRLHNELKQDALQYAFQGNAAQMIKGYTKEIMSPRVDYQLGTLADAAEMKRLGYTRSERPIERDRSDPTRHIDIYAYTADSNRINDYASTTASLTSNKAKGASTNRLAQQMDESFKTGAKNNQLIMQAKQAELDAMFFPHPKPLVPGGNPMVAQVDDQGAITKYRYLMSENTKDGHLEKTNEFDKVMGAMAGQTIDKARTPVINEELIDGLKAMYDGEYQKNPGAYVEVSPHSTDPKLREIYYSLPAKARQYIGEKWGDSRMFVAKDVLTIAFGYRKYSIVQAFAKTPAERHALEKVVVGVSNLVFRSHGLKVANNTEQVAMALTHLAKNNIVVKSLYITLSNFGSNWIHLKSRGVPMQEILTRSYEALQQGLKYQEDRQLLYQLKTKQKLMIDPSEIKKSELKISRLKDAIARNPVTRFIEAGGLPSLVDDLDTDAIQSNYPSKLEKFGETVAGKLPTPLVNVGKVMLLTHDTGAYKIMNNAVKMTDFIARYVLYQHYMKEAAKAPGFNRRDQAATDEAHSKSVIRVLEEFVNFDLPTHKTIEYLNNVGLVWFSRYVLRIQKVIVKSVIDKPFDAVAAMLLASTIGFDQIGNSLLGINRSITGPFDNPFDMFADNADEIFTVTSMKALLNF